MLPKVNKADMRVTMESIKEYLRSCNDFMRAPLAYIFRKTIIVKTYGDYTNFLISDDSMITRMLHLTPDDKLHDEQSAQSIKEHTAEYAIDNRIVYDILDQICKDTDLHLSVKQHESKVDGRGTFYAIHSRWLGPNHVNATASEGVAPVKTSPKKFPLIPINFRDT